MKISITPSVARIHAHICGDGCVYTKLEKYSEKQLQSHSRKQKHEKVWIIEYTNTCKELLESFEEDMQKAFNRKVRKKVKKHSLEVHSCKWIVDELNLQNKNSYNWQIPSFIRNSNQKVICSWLQAFFDDEATVCKTRKRIRVKSMHHPGLKQVKLILSKIRIDSNITGPNCDNSYYLTIRSSELDKYHKKVGFIHPAKVRILKSLGSNQCFQEIKYGPAGTLKSKENI